MVLGPKCSPQRPLAPFVLVKLIDKTFQVHDGSVCGGVS